MAAVAAAAFMFYRDYRAIFGFTHFDRAKIEEILDRAEHWLETWKAPALRILTLGLINPRRVVGEQVRSALVEASLAANGALWGTSLQVLARFVFGLVLWASWTVTL